MVWGNPVITIDPDSTIPYILHVLPWKRGIFKGNKTISKTLLTTRLGQIYDENNEKIYFTFPVSNK